jgi:ATP-dependent Clp protease ATP-binding subunit ClpC
VYPFERFSDDAKKVLVFCQTEAERAGHSYIGTEHMLLALLEVDSEARSLLLRLGVDEQAARTTIARVLGPGQRPVARQIVPTNRVKKAIELSIAQADRERVPHVTPRHLLVGVVAEGEGIAAHVLGDLGVTREAIVGDAEPQEDV